MTPTMTETKLTEPTAEYRAATSVLMAKVALEAVIGQKGKGTIPGLDSRLFVLQTAVNELSALCAARDAFAAPTQESGND